MKQTVKNSVKSVTHAVTSVPNNLITSVDNAIGISRVLTSNIGLDGGGGDSDDLRTSGDDGLDDGKVGASIDDSTDNIPLRIILLFMDEVFDLQDRNQWLRRQIVVVLKQLIKAMLGMSLDN